jgi:phosphonopyruvate decarboxylase
VIAPETFTDELRRHGVTFFVGVPDSLLKNLGAHFAAALTDDRHVITANEGAAVGMAIGHHLRTGEMAAVYMQNSGFGNAVNPLLSLADPEVYSIPMLLVVGWRGRPGAADEPQHVKQGRVMETLLAAIELPYFTLPYDEEGGCAVIRQAVDTAKARQCPAVVLVQKDTFDRPRVGTVVTAPGPELPSRESALHAVVDALGQDALVVTTTGMLSRELFEYRAADQAGDAADFLTVGGMGHASSIALGIALREPRRDVWCLDGDGALLMHAGTLAVAAQLAPPSYYHVVFNNGVHDSVGGQPTAIGNVDVPAFAVAAGYRNALSIRRLDAIAPAIQQVRTSGGPALIEVIVRPGSRSDIGRPTTTPIQNKTKFMAIVNAGKHSLAVKSGPV